MDFVVSLRRTVHDYDVMDQLTKSAHFITIKVTFYIERLVEIYIANIVRLNGVSLSIISDRDARFTSQF